jgi:hypothetical protein
MNERIRELAEQAKFAMNVSNDPNSPPSWWAAGHNDTFEKFAELIVRECLDKIETYRIPVGNSRSGELACEWTYDALKEIRDEIKETFGVE